jgi:flagellar basal-body rod protein FlgC
MFDSVFKIASDALSASRLRVNTIASNIANAQTTRTEEGGPYKRRDVVLTTNDLKDNKFHNALNEASVKTVKVVEVVKDESAPRMVYDPGHPDADKAGMVAMPNINPVSEMVNLMSASNSYKAAAEVVSVTKSMAQALTKLSQRF